MASWSGTDTLTGRRRCSATAAASACTGLPRGSASSRTSASTGRGGRPGRSFSVRAGLLGSWLVHVPVDEVEEGELGARGSGWGPAGSPQARGRARPAAAGIGTAEAAVAGLDHPGRALLGLLAEEPSEDVAVAAEHGRVAPSSSTAPASPPPSSPRPAQPAPRPAAQRVGERIDRLTAADEGAGQDSLDAEAGVLRRERLGLLAAALVERPEVAASSPGRRCPAVAWRRRCNGISRCLR